MKKALITAVALMLVLVFVMDSARAGGDKNRGDKGKGSVHQVVGP